MATQYGIKVRKSGASSWSFVCSDGYTNRLSIYAMRYSDAERCIGNAQFIANGNEGMDVKVVLFGKPATDYKLITECNPVARMPKPKHEILTGKDAYSQARHRAKTGHKDWLVWTGKDGECNAARLTGATLKLGMLAEGTKARMVHITPDGHGMILSWRLAVNYRKHCARGLFR